MNWNDDNWEDVIDSLSSLPEELSHINNKTVYDLHPVYNIGHVATETMGHGQDDTFRSSEARATGSIEHIPGGNAIKHPALELAKLPPENMPDCLIGQGSGFNNNVLNEAFVMCSDAYMSQLPTPGTTSAPTPLTTSVPTPLTTSVSTSLTTSVSTPFTTSVSTSLTTSGTTSVSTSLYRSGTLSNMLSLTTTSKDQVSSKAQSKNVGLKPNSRTSHKNGVKYVRIITDELDKFGTKMPIAATPPRASDTLQSDKTYVNPQTENILEKNSRTEDTGIPQEHAGASVSNGQYSQLIPGSRRPLRDYTLHEYEKQKMNSRQYLQDKYSAIYSNYHSQDQQDDKLLDDADEKNAIICLVFCIMGFGAVIGLIFVLVHFAKPSELKEFGNIQWEDNYEEFSNNVYRSRIAGIIRSESFHDQERLRQDTWTRPWDEQHTRQHLCDVDPPYLGSMDNNNCF